METLLPFWHPARKGSADVCVLRRFAWQWSPWPALGGCDYWRSTSPPSNAWRKGAPWLPCSPVCACPPVVRALLLLDCLLWGSARSVSYTVSRCRVQEGLACQQGDSMMAVLVAVTSWPRVNFMQSHKRHRFLCGKE